MAHFKTLSSLIQSMYNASEVYKSAIDLCKRIQILASNKGVDMSSFSMQEELDYVCKVEENDSPSYMDVIVAINVLASNLISCAREALSESEYSLLTKMRKDLLLKRMPLSPYSRTEWEAFKKGFGGFSA